MDHMPICGSRNQVWQHLTSRAASVTKGCERYSLVREGFDKRGDLQNCVFGKANPFRKVTEKKVKDRTVCEYGKEGMGGRILVGTQ
jgi:hypothetical protein